MRLSRDLWKKGTKCLYEVDPRFFGGYKMGPIGWGYIDLGKFIEWEIISEWE
jgi:hypothetical protein